MSKTEADTAKYAGQEKGLKTCSPRTIPELLAPAGGMKQMIAAVENGADAVYLGGPLFNARIHADNFTEDQIKEAIDYAHLRNVKIYITLNILLTDQELTSALHYAGRLYEMGADALILQDLGLADLVKTYMPDFPLHLSTQGSIYNLSGVKKAANMGFKRVVLARELSLEEIKSITSKTPCPVEVFAHGALCMCYSGQCQLSRALGDGSRSGNRGLCAQPCRLPYTPDQGKPGYILSPKDLCTINCLGELAEAGVASLKIEGRMKFPEYVAAVTAIYRKYLDQYAEKGSYAVSEEDWYILNQVFNRGSFTTGYLYGNPGKKLLSGTLPKHQGVYVGQVLGSAETIKPVRNIKNTDRSKSKPEKNANHFKKAREAGRKDTGKSYLIDVKLEKALNLGDGVEIRSRELTGNVVTYLEAKKGNIVRIGDIKGSVRPGDPVYRISDAKLMQDLRATYEQGGPQGSKHKKRISVDMEFQAKEGRHPRLTMREKSCPKGQTHSLEVTLTVETETVCQAERHPLTEDAVIKQLSKTGGTPFAAEHIKADIGENCALPLSVINRLRRMALTELAAIKVNAGHRSAPELPRLPIEPFITEPSKTSEVPDSLETKFSDKLRVRPVQDQQRSLAFYFFDPSNLAEGIRKLRETAEYLGADKSPLLAYVPLRFFMEDLPQSEALNHLQAETEGQISFIPYILNISKGSLDEYIQSHLEEIIEKTRKTGISIGNLSWIDEFLSKGVPVYADFGLNLYNRQARKVFEAQGVRFFTTSLEILEERSGQRGAYGSFPLMILEHPIRFERLSDRKKQNYKIVYNSESDKAMLFLDNSELNLEKIKNRWKKEEGEIRVYIP